MPPDAPYAPPLTLTPELLNRVAAIAEALSRWNPLLAWLPIEEVIRSRQQGDLQPFVAYQLEAIHDALRSEIGSEIGSEMGSKIDAVILRDLAAEPTPSARRLAGRLLRHGSPRTDCWQVL
jgi:hypothetical protein